VEVPDLSALFEWAEREDPRYSVWSAVESWCLDLAERPWQVPSVPYSLNEGEPTEIRTAELQDAGVIVAYSVHHETLQVIIIGITQR
jgi:hypothetical protein